jgi:hypothetical protein
MAPKYYSREWCDEAQRRLDSAQQHLKALNSLKRVCWEKPTEE